MKQIKLDDTHHTIVDNEDFDFLNQFNWKYCENGYAYLYKDNKDISMHRLVMDLEDTSKVVDHINGNKLDNRKDNLRICTQQQNICNRTVLNSNNTSGYRGVFKTASDLFMASIEVNKVPQYLGTFNSAEKAALAYNRAAREHFKEYRGLLNFSDIPDDILVKIENRVSRNNKKKHNTSGYRGVTRDKRSGRWQAEIRHNKKRESLGMYDNPVEAAKAYDRKAREIHGEDWYSLNFDKSVDISESKKITVNKNSSSGFVGVVQDNRSGRWQAKIGHNGKSLSLGYYNTAEEAAKAYDLKALELRGPNAKLNFPD